ncbi:MAG: lysophospholipid acyltransferase family protein [Muribaculaceae bacterium]|nr:lysophospholipid acyltransferase family protein [Muribaculaceae bacterium]
MKKETKNDIIYLPMKLFLHGIALLPFWLLYRLADFLYILLYYVVRYRRNIVRQNINESFPEKSQKERNRIIRKFYLHFADYFVETIKLLHISDEQMRRRMVFRNIELVDKSLDKKRSVIVYAGHYGNWEYLTSITLWSRYNYINDVEFAQIYRKLKNNWFDKFFYNLRSRFHSESFEKKTAFRSLLKIKLDGRNTVTGFISDQHPSGSDTNHIVKFLNHDTAIITGSEILAKKLDQDVFYFDIEKVKRGHYITTIKKITCCPSKQPDMAITDAYVENLETTIKRQPELWLWTHNRWKHECKHSAEPKTKLINDNE